MFGLSNSMVNTNERCTAFLTGSEAAPGVKSMDSGIWYRTTSRVTQYLRPHHHNAQQNTYARQPLARNSPCEGQRQGIPSLGKHIQRDVHGDGVFEQGRLAADNGAACQCLALDDMHEVRLQQVDNLLEQVLVLSGVRVEPLDEGLAGVAHDLCARAHRSDL